MTLPTQLLNLAGFAQSVTVGPSPDGAYTLAWYASGGQRAVTYVTSPGYSPPNAPSPVTNARDFLSQLVSSSPTTFTKRAFALTTYYTFNAKLSDYQNAVRDYVASGHPQWIGPFPQTIATMWRDLLASYAVAFGAAKALGIQLLQSQGTTSSVVPSSTTVQSKTVIPVATTTPTMVQAMTPEVIAQVTGTQRVTTPASTMSSSTALSPSAASPNAAQVAQQTMTAAGAPVEVDGPAVYADPRTVITHTPLYKMPAFWVACGAGLLLVGMAGYAVQKKRRA